MIERLLAAQRALEGGDLDQANHLFGQVAEADPRNAIAVVGLASVATRRGEDRLAGALLDRALAIDPDDAAAKQMRAKLEAPVAANGLAAPSPTETKPADEAEPGPAGSAEAEPEAEVPTGRRSFLDRLLALFRRPR